MYERSQVCFDFNLQILCKELNHRKSGFQSMKQIQLDYICFRD